MLISYISCFLEFLCFYILSKTFTAQSLLPKKSDFLWGILIISVIGYPSFSQPLLCLTVGYFFYAVYCIHIISYKILDGILLMLLCFGYILFIQICLLCFVSLLHLSPTDNYMQIIGNFCTLIFSVLLLKITMIRQLFNRVVHTALQYKLIFFDTFTIIVGIILVWKFSPYRIATSSLYAVIFIAFLICVNVAILYYDQLVKNQQKELDACKKNLPIYEALIKDIRTSQHEYVNRMQALHNLALFHSDFESLQSALLSYTDSAPKSIKAYPLLQINMPLLSASLYQLYCLSVEKGIQMQFNITSTELHSTVSEQNLADYICILTQNAIEACQSNDEIYIHISSTEGKVQFEIRNPVDTYISTKEIQRFFQKGYSTKHSSSPLERGYGLSYLLQQVHQKKGILFSDCARYEESYWIIFQLNI